MNLADLVADGSFFESLRKKLKNEVVEILLDLFSYFLQSDV